MTRLVHWSHYPTVDPWLCWWSLWRERWTVLVPLVPVECTLRLSRAHPQKSIDALVSQWEPQVATESCDSWGAPPSSRSTVNSLVISWWGCIVEFDWWGCPAAMETKYYISGGCPSRSTSGTSSSCIPTVTWWWIRDRSSREITLHLRRVGIFVVPGHLQSDQGSCCWRTIGTVCASITFRWPSDPIVVT